MFVCGLANSFSQTAEDSQPGLLAALYFLLGLAARPLLALVVRLLAATTLPNRAEERVGLLQ